MIWVGKIWHFLYATLHFKKPNKAELTDINILAKEAELYLPVGSYSIEIETREFKPEILNIDITDDDIEQRKWFDITLKS